MRWVRVMGETSRWVRAGRQGVAVGEGGEQACVSSLYVSRMQTVNDSPSYLGMLSVSSERTVTIRDGPG